MKYYYRYCERGEGRNDNFIRSSPANAGLVSAFPPKVRFRVGPLLIFAIFNRSPRYYDWFDDLFSAPPPSLCFLPVDDRFPGKNIIGVHGWMKRLNISYIYIYIYIYISSFGKLLLFLPFFTPYLVHSIFFKYNIDEIFFLLPLLKIINFYINYIYLSISISDIYQFFSKRKSIFASKFELELNKIMIGARKKKFFKPYLVHSIFFKYNIDEMIFLLLPLRKIINFYINYIYLWISISNIYQFFSRRKSIFASKFKLVK